MGLALEKTDRTNWTYSDYLKWDDSHRYELIDGEVYDMSPAPSTNHQRIIRKISFLFESYLRDKECEIFFAPFDVRFPFQKDKKDEEILTVLQPDIVVICDKSKIDEKGCKGAPDLVVEILSPDTFKHDMQVKRDIYEKAGVLEYLAVDPLNKIIYFFLLKDGMFQKPMIYTDQETFSGNLFNDLEINLSEVLS